MEHGDWLPWLEGNCPSISARQAQRYLAMAKYCLAHPEDADALQSRTLRDALRLLADQSPAKCDTVSYLPAPTAKPPVEKESRVAPAPAPDLDFSTYEPEDDETFKANMENVIMADDRLAKLMEELKQAHRELQAVKSSRDHYMSESGAAVRAAKAKDREIEKLKKDLQKAPCAPKADPDDPERPDDIDEDAGIASAEADLARRINALMEGDDKLATAVSQLKQQSHLIGILETTRDGYMRGKQEVLGMLKKEQAKSARLQRDNDRLLDQIEALKERVAIMEEG
jgi:DNA repair exonuclease SbcCD ATPase subunit